MNFDTDDLITVSEASSRGVSSLVSDAAAGRPKVVLRNGKPAAAVVDIESMERLRRLDELEDDLRLLSVALARTMVDTGRRYTLDEVDAELGLSDQDDDED